MPRKLRRRALRILLLFFVLTNVLAAMHAWRFTHFTDSRAPRKTVEQMSVGDKALALISGAPNPRPENTRTPTVPYETITLQSARKLECWYIPAEKAKGDVAVFHGYGGCKSNMLDKAAIFREAGYNVLLADFAGTGGSEGNQTTIGWKEADDVKVCYDYLRRRHDGDSIILFGPSLGAVAILRAVSDKGVQPAGIIIECPYGTLYETICARFRMMHLPAFPLARVLQFWGGVENGFNAFELNPSEFAKKARCPALLFYGEQDDRVTRKEIDAVYGNLAGKKKLVLLPRAGHNNYLDEYRAEWTGAVREFLSR